MWVLLFNKNLFRSPWNYYNRQQNILDIVTDTSRYVLCTLSLAMVFNKVAMSGFCTLFYQFCVCEMFGDTLKYL